MSTHQIHFDRKFYLDLSTGYWISTTSPRIRAHQWVWINTHGPIPKKCHIHHKDEDKSNNSIDNLQLIHGKQHASHHMVKYMLDPENKKKAQENCDKIRPMTKAWHASSEGIAWHKLHAIIMNLGNGESYKYKCEQCSKDYESKLKAEGRTKFCSNACKSAWRRMNKLDDILKKCPICDKDFSISRYRKTKTCSRVCGSIFRKRMMQLNLKLESDTCEAQQKEASLCPHTNPETTH